jgi:hypothetical protein
MARAAFMDKVRFNMIAIRYKKFHLAKMVEGVA